VPSFDHEPIRRFLAERRQEVVELCRGLIRVPSEDPPGDTRPIADFIRQYLRDRGIPTTCHAPDPQRPNLVGRLELSRPGPNVVFNGHMETLPVGDRGRWTHDPFAGVIADGRLYGRGASCMKGGIAGLISAALALREHADQLGGSVTLLLVSDEVNGGGVGTGWMLEHVAEARGDVALVGEGGPAITFGHKGPVFVEFRASGDGGHGAYGFGKASGTHRMLGLLHDLRQLDGLRVAPPAELRGYIEASRRGLDAQLGPGATDALMALSVNVGRVEGGHKVNVIAEACTAHVDFRVPPGMTVEELLARVQGIVERHPGVTWHRLWANGPTAASPEHPWLRLLQETSREVFGEALPFRVTHGFTDARFFHLQKIPAAAIGRRGANVGAPDEYIEVDSLLGTTALFAVAAFDYLSGP
jgi:succinyl-diaminopimelate desuccinylase